MPDSETKKTPEFQISNWKPREKNTLRGFFSITLPNGLIIHDVMLHEKGDRRWISLPAREYTDENGQRAFTAFLEFSDKTIAKRFHDRVLAALDRHFAEMKAEVKA